MKKRIFAMMALAAALCACSKEQDAIYEPQTPEVNPQESTVFTATMEGAPKSAMEQDAPETKATFDDTYKCASWEIGDKISINGKTYSAQTAGTTTTFKADDGAAAGDTYNAYFPASLYDGTTATLPAVQTAEAGKFDMPMYAHSEDDELQFKNLCAVLAIKVTSADIATLKSIKVASDKKMNGTFTVTEGKAVLVEDGTNVVVLESPEVLNLSAEGTTFYIAIPAQEYQYLNIFLSSDGTTYTQAMATNNASGLGEIARSKIFNIDYAKNATKLWATKILFADCNVGAKSETEYGGYYTWGGHVDQSVISDGVYKEGKVVKLTGTDDTAIALWGSNWRMPTKSELSKTLPNKGLLYWCEVNFIENYNGTGVNGWLYQGKNDYASNSIFLPAAGNYISGKVIDQGSEGYFWSSEPHSSTTTTHAYRVVMKDQSMGTVSRSYCYSVRAVLVEP